MSKITVTILTCDRCGKREEIERPDQGWIWGRIHFSQVNGPIWIGSQHNKPSSPDYCDMCPSCMKDAQSFWQAGKVIAS